MYRRKISIYVDGKTIRLSEIEKSIISCKSMDEKYWYLNKILTKLKDEKHSEIDKIIKHILTSNHISPRLKRFFVETSGGSYRGHIDRFIYGAKSNLKIILKLFYDDKYFEAYHVIGKDRFKVNSAILYDIVCDPRFTSGHIVAMSGENYSDVNIRAVFLYQHHAIDDKVLNKIIDIVESDGYNGYMSTDQFKKIVKQSIKKFGDFKNVSSTTKLYLEL